MKKDKNMKKTKENWFQRLNQNQKAILRVAVNLLKKGAKVELSPKKWKKVVKIIIKE